MMTHCSHEWNFWMDYIEELNFLPSFMAVDGYHCPTPVSSEYIAMYEDMLDAIMDKDVHILGNILQEIREDRDIAQHLYETTINP